MPYTSKQKALLLPMLEKMQTPNFRQSFALVVQKDYFDGNDLGIREFQKNMELLHRYKGQLQKKQPTELTEEQFLKVWTAVQKYCGSALPKLQKKITEVDQNSEERAMIQVCINCVGDYKNFFEKVDAQEKKYDEMPHQEPVVTPSTEPVPFSSDEVVPYFAALDQRNVLDKMDDLAEDTKLSPEKTRQFQEYRNAVAMLTHYAREKSQGHPADPATEQLAKQAPETAFRQQLGAMAAQLNKMHKAGRNTGEYRRFREALNAAAKDRNLDALRQAAQAYCTAKTAGGKRPSSSWGLGRLGVAESVLGMLDDYQSLTAVR